MYIALIALAVLAVGLVLLPFWYAIPIALVFAVIAVVFWIASRPRASAPIEDRPQHEGIRSGAGERRERAAGGYEEPFGRPGA